MPPRVAKRVFPPIVVQRHRLLRSQLFVMIMIRLPWELQILRSETMRKQFPKTALQHTILLSPRDALLVISGD